jgi:predicted GNAT superfamily acetyltransferase
MTREAWEPAHGAAAAAGVELRPLTSLGDADEILRVMIETWGEHQLIPREMLRALGDSANPPFGAVAEGELIGYVLGWMAVDRDDGVIVHSHMLATVPERRHRGVGYALKLAQRAQALEHGVRIVRWTFDPLISRNAWFNIGKLGAAGDRFHRNFYGAMDDIVNRGERSDRLVVRWDLEPEPGPWNVGVQGEPVLVRGGNQPDVPRPVRAGEPTGEAVIVEIPRDHQDLRTRDRGLADAWRDAAADAIEACLSRGMFAAAFDRDRCCYVFARTRNRISGTSS